MQKTQVPVTAELSFSKFLSLDFEDRKNRAAEYSLRKYAKDLELNDSSLSQLLRGKRTISADMAKSIGEKMGLEKAEVSYLIQMQEFSDQSEFSQLDQEAFMAIEDWRLDVLRERLKRKKTNFDQAEMANSIGVSEAVVQKMLSYLQSNGLILEKSGKYSNPHDLVSALPDSGYTSQSARQYQKALLQKSMETVDSISVSKRSHSSMVFSMRPSDLQLAAELIKNFRAKLNQDFENNDTDTAEIYALQIGLFPLTQSENQK